MTDEELKENLENDEYDEYEVEHDYGVACRDVAGYLWDTDRRIAERRAAMEKAKAK